MNEGLIPNRYARALYRYSRDCGDADTVYAQTCRLADSFLRVDGIASAAENPFLALADKEALLLAAAGAEPVAPRDVAVPVVHGVLLQDDGGRHR